MKLSRRGLILGGAATLAACATAGRQETLNLATVSPAELPPVTTAIEVVATAQPKVVMDPRGLIRKDLLDAGLAALERHGARVPNRDGMYLVDFERHSAEPRLYDSSSTTAASTCSAPATAAAPTRRTPASPSASPTPRTATRPRSAPTSPPARALARCTARTSCSTAWNTPTTWPASAPSSSTAPTTANPASSASTASWAAATAASACRRRTSRRCARPWTRAAAVRGDVRRRSVLALIVKCAASVRRSEEFVKADPPSLLDGHDRGVARPDICRSARREFAS